MFRRGSSPRTGDSDHRGNRARQAGQARLAEREEPDAEAQGFRRGASQLGLAVSDLTEAQKKELKLKGGVKVDAATGAAARAGLREGDVILAMANVEVANLKEFESALAKADKSKAVSVLFRRGDWAQYALIRPNVDREVRKDVGPQWPHPASRVWGPFFAFLGSGVPKKWRFEKIFCRDAEQH